MIKLILNKILSSVTQKVFKDFNSLSDEKFMLKYFTFLIFLSFSMQFPFFNTIINVLFSGCILLISIILAFDI